MNRVARLLALLPVLWSISAAGIEQGDAAPAWSATGFSGQALEFPQLTEGRPAVVVFWATWCPYCKAFMPYLERIESDYRAAGVKIVAINAKERGQGDPRAYVEDLGFPMVAVPDGDSIAEAYGVDYIPGLFVVDGHGTVAFRRSWTELPAGREVAELWDGQVRSTLDRLVQ